MTAAVFVDTNVFVYACDTSEVMKHSVAADCVRALWAEHRGRTSTQVLNEFYVATTRKLKPGLQAEEAWDYVQALFAWEPQDVTRDLLSRAREIERRYSTSWWDSLIVAAAELQDCSQLLTEDLQDGMVFGSVTVRNPFAMGISEEPARIATAPLAVSRHRARGRPRKHSTLR
jgi:predicted nucleic acid-binding protein